MAKEKKEKKIKQKTLGGTLIKAVATLVFPPAGVAFIIDDFAKENKQRNADNQRHAEIQTMIDLEKDKAAKVENLVKEEDTTKKEES